MNQSKKRAAQLFVLVLICVGVAESLGAKNFSNYYNEVFHITAVQRGFLEIPRESPGILCMVLVAALGSLGNIWMSVISQLLSLIGLVVMGCMSPTYGVMLVFLFIQSLGSHFFMPLSDTLSMELSEKGKVGTGLGRFKGVTTMSAMVSACVVFVGFRFGLFTFDTPVILPFVIAAVFSVLAILLLMLMARDMGKSGAVASHGLLIRRRYMPYYMVTLAYGCQKRIRIVFAPWVIIQLLGQGADTVALLTIIVHLVGSWMAPRIGRLLDKLGVRKMLWMEAAYIGVTFSVMGMTAGLLSRGTLAAGGWQSWIVFGAYILCVLFEQFGMVHSFMMRSIALDQSEVTRTLSVGLGVDHIMAIIASPMMGIIWERFGVQYVFYLAALSALLQLAASLMVKETNKSASLAG